MKVIIGKLIQVNLNITFSLVSMESDHNISEPCYNDIYSKIINLRAMTWPHYIENHTIVRCVIMRLNCTIYKNRIVK